MSEPKHRVHMEEPVQAEGPKGYYRRDTPYDPFTPTGEEGEAEPPRSSRQRRRKSRKSWKSIKPRPNAASQESGSGRALWFGMAGAVVGFFIGFIARPLFEPGARIPNAVLDSERLPPKPDMERLQKETEASIRGMSRDIDEQAIRPLGAPDTEGEPLSLSPEPPPSVEDSLLKLQPPPPVQSP